MKHDLDSIQRRLKMVLTDTDMRRLSITNSGSLSITVDVHGMHCNQARRFINNIINIVQSAFQLIVIHGYNHGTAIKDMLSNSFSNTHITDQYVDFYNPGITHMQIAA